MPMYNVENYIGKAIKSVIAQTYTDWELIIVNDGSTDHSKEIAINTIASHPRITIVDKTNGGLSDARNFGLSFAEGDYIHFFDSDDFIAETFYEEMIGSIQQENPDIVISGYTVYTVNKENHASSYKKTIAGFPAMHPSAWSSFISSYFNFAWNKFFRRDFIDKHNLRYEKGLSKIEDCEFMSRVMSFNPIIRFNNSTGYYYRNDIRTTLSKVFNSTTIHLSQRRIICSRTILRQLKCEKPLLSLALDSIRFHTIRGMLHNIFSNKVFTPKERYKLVKNILHAKELAIHSSCDKSYSFVDKVLWYTIQYHFVAVICCLYSVKK